MKEFNIEINAIALAEMLGVSDRYIRKLATEGIVARSGTRGKYLLAESIRNYIGFLKDSTSANVSLKDLKLEKETLRLDKDIELKSIKIQEMKNELHSAEIVERVMTDMLLNLKGKLLSVPNKVAPLVVGCDNLGDIQSIVQDAISDTLLELTDYNKDMFKNKNVVVEDEEQEDGKKEKSKKATKKTRRKKSKKNV